MADRKWGTAIEGRYGAALAMVLLALPPALAGCADHVQSSLATCPCSQGMVCCESGVCAADESACAQATSALSNDSAGHWTGYVENFAFASGSDALDLTLTAGSDGSLSGQLILGMGTMPPPATDGTVGWPSGQFSFDSLGLPLGALEGYGYHLNNVKWTALRLQFEIDIAEPWGPWCRLQNSSDSACVQVHGGYGTNAGECFTPTGMQQVDCGLVYLCADADVCVCSPAGCDAATAPIYQFDVALRNNDGDGSVVDNRTPGVTLPGQMPATHNVRLIRASN